MVEPNSLSLAKARATLRTAYQAEVADLAATYVAAIRGGRFDWETDFGERLESELEHHARVTDQNLALEVLCYSENRDKVNDPEESTLLFSPDLESPPSWVAAAFCAMWWDVWDEMTRLLGKDPERAIADRWEDLRAGRSPL